MTTSKTKSGAILFNGKPWNGATNLVGAGHKAKFRRTFLRATNDFPNRWEDVCSASGGLDFDASGYHKRGQ